MKLYLAITILYYALLHVGIAIIAYTLTHWKLIESLAYNLFYQWAWFPCSITLTLFTLYTLFTAFTDIFLLKRLIKH